MGVQKNSKFERLGDKKMSEFINVKGGKTGSKIHIGHPNSSGTYCGIWLKYNLSCFKTDLPVTCEKCLQYMKIRNIEVKK